MRAVWIISRSDLNRWRHLVETSKRNELVLRRKRLNIQRKGIVLSRQAIWRVLVGCQVTTQQRSGPNSTVSRFLKSRSPALRYGVCRDAPSLQVLIEEECKTAGLRRGPTVAVNLASILAALEAGEWKVLRRQLGTLEHHTTPRKERLVVKYLESGTFPGLGPKQSRNFIQWLGLSRYEVPLDSRVLKTLRLFGATFVPGGTALTDEAVYDFVQSGLQQISKALRIYPCILDACIFSSLDADSAANEDDEGESDDSSS